MLELCCMGKWKSTWPFLKIAYGKTYNPTTWHKRSPNEYNENCCLCKCNVMPPLMHTYPDIKHKISVLKLNRKHIAFSYIVKQLLKIPDDWHITKIYCDYLSWAFISLCSFYCIEVLFLAWNLRITGHSSSVTNCYTSLNSTPAPLECDIRHRQPLCYNVKCSVKWTSNSGVTSITVFL